MKRESLSFYRCPLTGNELEISNVTESDDSKIIVGTIHSKEINKDYFIKNEIPDFTICNEKEKEKNEYAVSLFKEKARQYDKYQHLSFETFYEDETNVRNSIIDKLNLNTDFNVLEVNAGTGRDSILIAKRLSKNGLLHVQDISGDMLDICKKKLQNAEVPI